MKKVIFILILVITQSCFKKSENDIVKSEVKVLKENKKNSELAFHNDTITKNLKDFYRLYLTENAKNVVDKDFLEKLKNKYLTRKLIVMLEKTELNYDPLVNAQDYNIDWLKNIVVSKDNLKTDTYNVIITDNNIKTIISLIIKKEQNQYKIDYINNVPDTINEPENDKVYSENELVGEWKLKCEENYSAIIMDSKDFGYLDIYTNNDYARVALNLDENNNYKYSVLTGITRYNKFVNWVDISTDSVFCKIKALNNHSLKLEWLGFYNKKTKKREMIRNPFEKGLKNQNIIYLNKCE